MRYPSVVVSCLAATGALAIALSVSLGIWKSGMPGPGLFPLVSAILLIAALAATLLERLAPEEAAEALEPRRFLGYAAAILAFVGLMDLAGTLLAIFVFLLSVIALVEQLSWRLALLVSFGAAITCWAVFVGLLGVPLPAGIWS